MNYQQIFEALTSDRRYLENLDWGKPRRGHPEGTVRAHILQLEENLAAIREDLPEEEVWKLMILIHVHDTFKAKSKRGVPIAHPESHASLAAQILSEFCNDGDLLAMVRLHDEPFALYRGWRNKGRVDQSRVGRLVDQISDWELFFTFIPLDGVMPGKSPEPLYWSAEQIGALVGQQLAATQLIDRLVALQRVNVVSKAE